MKETSSLIPRYTYSLTKNILKHAATNSFSENNQKGCSVDIKAGVVLYGLKDFLMVSEFIEILVIALHDNDYQFLITTGVFNGFKTLIEERYCDF